MLATSAGLTPWLGMFVGAALAALLGAIIGYLGFRFGLRGFYFVLLTVAFAEICRIAVSNIDALGGPLGLYITFTGDPRQFQFQDARAYYYIALALMLVATATAWAIGRRRFGIYLRAIREDETAAEALGVNAFKYKMLAMVVSSFLTGLGGAFYAFYLFSLQPNTLFGIPLSVGDTHPPLSRAGRPAWRAPDRLRRPPDLRGAVSSRRRLPAPAPGAPTQPGRTSLGPRRGRAGGTHLALLVL